MVNGEGRECYTRRSRPGVRMAGKKDSHAEHVFGINDYVSHNRAWDQKDGNELKRGYKHADRATPTFFRILDAAQCESQSKTPNS